MNIDPSTKTCKREIPQQQGFILREFVLKDDKMAFETDVNMGTPLKDAWNKIPRRHCILCNRYLTTFRAARIAAGIRDPPSNTIQDHRNYFNAPGEYPYESMLIFSGDFCGIIGEIVGFKASDYIPSRIVKYKYNTTTKEEREAGKIRPDQIVSVRTWIEKNRIDVLRKQDEGKSVREK